MTEPPDAAVPAMIDAADPRRVREISYDPAEGDIAFHRTAYAAALDAAILRAPTRGKQQVRFHPEPEQRLRWIRLGLWLVQDKR